MNVGLYPLPTLSLPTILPKAKAAFSFAVHSYVINAEPLSLSSTEASPKQSQPIPSIITILLVGCRRKAVIYSWKDGEPQEVRVRLNFLFEPFFYSHYYRRHLFLIQRAASYFWITILHASHIHQQNLPCSHSRQ